MYIEQVGVDDPHEMKEGVINGISCRLKIPRSLKRSEIFKSAG